MAAPAASSAKRSSRPAATGYAEATASAKSSRLHQRAELARRGESVVASLLEERGYTILGRNVRAGRLELDIVARRGRLVVVCEVRSRRSAALVHPAETIVGHKLERVRRATAKWLRSARLGQVRVRIDAAAVIFDSADGTPRVDYYENVSFPLRSG